MMTMNGRLFPEDKTGEYVRWTYIGHSNGMHGFTGCGRKSLSMRCIIGNALQCLAEDVSTYRKVL